MSAGTSLNVGGVVSAMVTVNDLLALLLCESVALHVTVVTPTANVEPEAGVQLEVETASSGSLALNVYVTALPLRPVASAVIFAGTVISGGVLSVTTTLNVLVASCPDRSLALQVTSVVPIGNDDPDAGEHVTGRSPSTASVAIGFAKVTTLLPPGDTSAFTTGAAPKTGGIVS
jgi:hypothetical protein